MSENSLQLYHGSPRSFNEFRLQNYPRVGSALGFGVYLTDNKERARAYADNGYLYQVAFKKKAFAIHQRNLSTDKRTLSVKEVQALIEGVVRQQIKEDGYPYLISDWAEPSSETELDEGNQEICSDIARRVRSSNHTDILILNEINNEIGAGPGALSLMAPALASLNIRFALSTFEEAGRIKHDYVVFNPADLQITKMIDLSQEKENEAEPDIDDFSH